jgi:membrane-anchored protein YejM (alkaline phosphatase superfamily)
MNSWAKTAMYDGQKTTVFNQSGVNEVYNKEYSLQKNLRPDNKQALQTIQINSEFLK